MDARGKKIRKILGWFLMVMAALLLAVLVIAWLLAPGYFKENFPEYLHEKSNGNYSIHIGGIERSIFPFAVKFTDISLTPGSPGSNTSSSNTDGTPLRSLFASEIELSGINFRRLYKNREFSCKRINIVKPEVNLSGDYLLQNDSAGTTDKIIPEIRPLFDGFLKKINIKTIELFEANFGFYGSTGDSSLISNADQVSLEIQGFRTDSAMFSRNSNFIETDDVLIRMKDFRNDMGDSLHVTTIDTLEYSLKTSDIRAAGFRLFPLDRKKDKNLFEVDVPEVYVQSRSITRFALNDSLKIRFLEFKHPEIKFFQKENPTRLNLEDINNFDLYTLVQNQFSKMEVDSFFLTGANLRIYRQPDYTNYQQQFESIDINLSRFSLDSVSSLNREKLLHSDNLEMKVAGYHLRLEDNQHHFRADSLFVSTFSNQLEAKNIHILPSNKQEINTRTEVLIDCEALIIDEVDLLDLYHARAIPTSKIEILTPKVHLKYHMERQKAGGQKEAGLLFELVSDYLSGVYSKLVYIENGRLDIDNLRHGELQGFFETGFNFSLTDFALDSASVQRTDKFFYATNFDLHFSDYQMRLVDDLHKLDVENVVISSMNQEVQIKNLNLHPVTDTATISTMRQYNRSELFNISVPEINLSGVDLQNAFFNKKLKINNFTISNPQIDFENFGTLRESQDKIELNEFYQLVFNYMDDFDIKRFSAPNGKLTWVNHTRKGKTISFDNAFSASLENFRLNEAELNKQRLLFSDNFDITLKDQQFELSDSVHVLHAGEVHLSSVHSLVSVKNAMLYPQISSSKYKDLTTTFQVSIPELQINNFDFRKSFYSKEPEIGRMNLISPKIQVYSRKGEAKSLDLKKYRFPLPAFIQSFKSDELKITRGEVVTYETTGNDYNASANFQFNLTIPEAVLKNNEENQAELASSNIVLELLNFKTPLEKNHNLLIEQVLYNRNKQTISVKGLEVDPFMPQQNDNRFSIHAPAINLTDFDLETALKENNFSFEKIEINNPGLDIEINQKIEGDTLEFLQTLDLYPYIEPLVDQVKVNNLLLKNADLKFNWMQQHFFENNINLSFENILMAENQPPQNILNSKEFEISTTDLTAESNDGLYEFTADSLIYNSMWHRVLLKNIQITPQVAKEVFPRKKGFQTDVVKAGIEYAELQGINEKRWLQNNILDASILTIGPASLEIFRNKRYPFNPNQEPPWPQDLMKSIKQPFILDSVELLPSHIRYSELMGISDQPGYIEFTNLNLNGGRISNIEKERQLTGHFVARANAYLQNQAKLTARFNFDLTSNHYLHHVEGSLQPMPLSSINTMLDKSTPMLIEDGNLSRFDFEISFHEHQAEGVLYMGYDNLKIAVMDLSGNEAEKAGFASFWANKMILNSKTSKEKNLKPIPVLYERDEQRSVINYWWKALYSGAKKGLGIESE